MKLSKITLIHFNSLEICIVELACSLLKWLTIYDYSVTTLSQPLDVYLSFVFIINLVALSTTEVPGLIPATALTRSLNFLLNQPEVTVNENTTDWHYPSLSPASSHVCLRQVCHFSCRGTSDEIPFFLFILDMVWCNCCVFEPFFGRWLTYWHQQMIETFNCNAYILWIYFKAEKY